VSSVRLDMLRANILDILPEWQRLPD
jgi:hypothetical protein